MQFQQRTEQTLDQAVKQHAKGQADLSENWIAKAQATLDGVQRILNAAEQAPAEIVRPFTGKPSRFHGA